MPDEPEDHPFKYIQTVLAFYKLWQAYQLFVREVINDTQLSAPYLQPRLVLTPSGAGGVTVIHNERRVALIEWPAIVEGVRLLKDYVYKHQATPQRAKQEIPNDSALKAGAAPPELKTKSASA